MAREVYIIGTDPGFASFGLSVIRLTPKSEEVVETLVIRTQKSVKKLNVKAVDDNFRRAQAIAAALYEIVNKWKPMALTAESMSFPRNSSAASKVAMVWGILALLCNIFQLPMVQATPQEIKKRLCDNKSATKEQIRVALERMYPGQFDPFKDSTAAGQWEHGFDAAGSVVACMDTDVLRMARGMCEG